jgi:plasmid stability protein
MSTTLTVRLDEALREKLEMKAKASGRTLSELVRDTLRDTVENRPLGERIGHLKGRFVIPRDDDDPWRRQIAERNWRP